MHTAEEVKLALEPERSRLFKSYSEGRPDGWSCDVRTKDAVCLAGWFEEFLVRFGCNDHDRRTQMAQFNRRFRSEEDLFTLVAELMNDTEADNIPRDRLTHRRWG